MKFNCVPVDLHFSNLFLLFLLLILRWLYSLMRTFASLMDFSQSSSIDLTVPRPHLRFPNCWLFPGWGCQPHAQPPTWRTRSTYLYPLETGWPIYTPRHRVPILVAFYDMHGLLFFSPVTTRGFCNLHPFLKCWCLFIPNRQKSCEKRLKALNIKKYFTWNLKYKMAGSLLTSLNVSEGTYVIVT
jgi:hypothetical protein